MALVSAVPSYSQSHQMSEKEVSKLAAILQQAKDILCRELPWPVCSRSHPGQTVQQGVVEISTGNLEDQAGARGCPRVCYSDAGGLTRDEGSGLSWWTSLRLQQQGTLPDALMLNG